MQRKINEACTAAAYVLFLAGSLFLEEHAYLSWDS
jgi:hypothetical protein